MSRRKVHRSIYFKFGKDKRFEYVSVGSRRAFYLAAYFLTRTNIFEMKNLLSLLRSSTAKLRRSGNEGGRNGWPFELQTSYSCSSISEHACAIYTRYTRIFYTGQGRNVYARKSRAGSWRHVGKCYRALFPRGHPRKSRSTFASGCLRVPIKVAHVRVSSFSPNFYSVNLENLFYLFERTME